MLNVYLQRPTFHVAEKRVPGCKVVEMLAGAAETLS